jgi:hypothetical protein
MHATIGIPDEVVKCLSNEELQLLLKRINKYADDLNTCGGSIIHGKAEDNYIYWWGVVSQNGRRDLDILSIFLDGYLTALGFDPITVKTHMLLWSMRFSSNV